ncbi:GntR family transcriptional regulator [Streptomyces badius]
MAALYEADRLADGEAQVRHTVGFHREMVRAAGNAVLLHTWEGLGIEVFTALSIRWLGAGAEFVAEEHQALIDAFLADPPDRGPGEAGRAGCAPRA